MQDDTEALMMDMKMAMADPAPKEAPKRKEERMWCCSSGIGMTLIGVFIALDFTIEVMNIIGIE